MKNLRLAMFFSLLFVSFSCLAQDRDYKWGLGVSFGNIGMFENIFYDDQDIGYADSQDNNWMTKNYSIGLSGYYFLNSNKMFRMKIQKANEMINTTTDGRNSIPHAGAFSSRELSLEQSILSIEPGIIWKENLKKISIYGGGLCLLLSQVSLIQIPMASILIL